MWRWRRDLVRPDGNNVGGPSHAAARYTDCSTTRSEPSRSNSPNYKIIILRLAPPGNTRPTRPPLLSPSASFAMFSAPLLGLPFRFFFSSPLAPPPSSSSYLSGSRRSSLIVRQDEDVHSLLARFSS